MAGTVVLTTDRIGDWSRAVTITCTGDASDGSFPATNLATLLASAPVPLSGKLVALQTNPGSTAPTDNYDITLVDADGLDRLQGLGANRDTSNSEAVAIVYSTTSIHPPVAPGETLTLTLANNLVASAVVVLTLYFTS